LPEADLEDIYVILNGERAAGVPNEVRALYARVVADFLREGSYKHLADAMDKLGLDKKGIDALIERRCWDALGYKTD
jgi:hypothetical protein